MHAINITSVLTRFIAPPPPARIVRGVVMLTLVFLWTRPFICFHQYLFANTAVIHHLAFAHSPSATRPFHPQTPVHPRSSSTTLQRVLPCAIAHLDLLLLAESAFPHISVTLMQERISG